MSKKLKSTSVAIDEQLKRKIERIMGMTGQSKSEVIRHFLKKKY